MAPPPTSPPTVSIVVASHNHEAYIPALIESILAQTFTDFEVIIIDDGSTDNTVGAARAALSGHPRARLLAQENRGVVKARNRGVSLARGQFVTIVDSDDLLPPERLRWQVDALQSHPDATMVYGNAEAIDETGRRLGTHFDNYPPVEGDFSAELWANYCFVPAISVMFRRAAWERSGPFWGPGPNTDYLKWIELGLLGPVICLEDRELGRWRRHGANTSMAPPRKRARQYHATKRGLAALLRRHPSLARRLGPRRIRARHARCHFMAGFYAGLSRDWPLARAEFARALRIDPTPTHLAALASALPPATLLSHGAYRLAESRFLKVRR